MGKEKTYKELVKEYEHLSTQLKDAEEQCAKKGVDWDEMLKETNEIRVKLLLNDQQQRLIKDPTMQFGKTWNGELIPIEEFVRICQNELYSDNDGYGRYATEKGVSDVAIYPSDILDDKYRKDFSHVMWFNK